jgi:hypothetical protein
VGNEFGIAPEPRLSRPVAGAYLGMVAALYLSHLVVLVLALATGRSSWRSEDPLLAVVVLAVIAACWLILALVWRQLEPGRNLLAHPLRTLALFYGAAVPVAWRSVRGTVDARRG